MEKKNRKKVIRKGKQLQRDKKKRNCRAYTHTTNEKFVVNIVVVVFRLLLAMNEETGE